MKKFLWVILSVLLGICLCSVTVYAEETTVSYDETLAALLDASGTEALITEQGMDSPIKSHESLTSYSFEQILQDLAEKAVDAAAQPVRTFGLLMGVILLSAFAQSLQSSQASVTAVYEMICVLCAVGVIAEPFCEIFRQTSAHLEASTDFMIRFSAVFGAVLAVCGGVTAAAGFQAAMLAVCEIAMQVAVHVMLPVLSMGLAMSIVDAVNPEISLAGIVKLLHKTVVWLLGLMMSLFLGMLSLQSMAAMSTDKLTSKTAKFVVSNAIPFVGSAVSDACSTVMGSMDILRSTTGIIGIVSVLSLLLPVLLQLGIYRLLTAAAAAAAELFAVQGVTRLLKNAESILAAAFSVSVSFAVIFVVSVAIMLLLGGNLISG